MWKNTGRKRPDFALEPGPGQESVWDYPRPPVAEPSASRIEIRANGRQLAAADGCYRLKETASPPTIYIPATAVDFDQLVDVAGRSFCEWKGAARYWALEAEPDLPVAWAYPEPSQAFSMLADHLSFYPARVECFIDGERVRSQTGGFYGGWITDAIVGPFKGDPGTGHW